MVWEFGTRGVARLAEAADVDFVVFDMEHSGFELDRIADLLSWARACSFAPFVRVPTNTYPYIARVLDAGALGIMAPNVKSAPEARTILEAMKYAPAGERGVGLGTAHTDYLAPDPAAYFAESNARTTLICQIESREGVADAGDIAAIDGVDVLWVGHFDLSVSLGIPGQFQNPVFLDSLKRVIAAGRKHGKRLGIQPGNAAQLEEWLELGFDVISWGADASVYRDALTAGVKLVRGLTSR
jgi:2-dehydro-3-deoxyglucarate aldolase/4-hydroxy-2-oxoheptanedioate aldolase